MNLLTETKFKCSVSSVLNKDVKQYGKQFLFDGLEDTAWYSNEGSPQWISIIFDEGQSIASYSLQFQGGFAASDATIKIENTNGIVLCEDTFYPEDINATQSFQLTKPIKDKLAVKVKFLFNGSTDFFGRIILYDLRLSPNKK